MKNWQAYGFSGPNLCTRPRQPLPHGTDHRGLPLTHGKQRDPEHEEKVRRAHVNTAINKLEQHVRDALWSRTTVHVGEERVLKATFQKLDRDGSGQIDFKEFTKALELLGLHTTDVGLPGPGGVDSGIVQALFERYDTDGSGEVDYCEFCDAVLKDSLVAKML